MAATRTSVSLIGFGFTVSEFFTKIRSNLPADIRDVRPEIPRNLGLLLIGVGVLSLAIFLMQYRTAVHYLRSSEFTPILAKGQKPLQQPTYYYACGVLLIGIAAFVAVLLRF
jgi:putative membrane protein